MTVFASISAQSLDHALGWSLFDFCWQGAVVAILLACILALFSRRPPQHRYTAACCALVLMIALPAVTFAHLAARPQTAPRALADAAPEQIPPLPLRSSSRGRELWLDQAADAVVEALDRSVPWVVALWFAGVILLLGRMNLGLFAVRRLKLAAVQPAPIELRLRLLYLGRRLGIARPVAMFNSALVQAPAVVGWLRPAILLPIGCLAGLSPIQIEALLAHELAHIRRHDYLVNVFQSLAETLLFYHPAVWWVSKQIRTEREHCCDDLAVRMSGDSLAYAKALSFLEEHRSAVPAVALGANGGALAMRIKRLLGGRQTPALSRFAAFTLLAIAVAAAGLYIGTFARAQAGTTNQPDFQTSKFLSNDGSLALPAIYRAWLNEDVRWIITPQERAAFLKLTNNNDRDEFIKQFWERRNPTPGAQENTFKQQHYRRIAYANQHFASVMPGWETDRGRIYIIYGPPDAIDSHPVGTAASPRPIETWHYRQVQEQAPLQPETGTSGYQAQTETRRNVDMTFVDVCSCGDYRLQ
jgi:GWxTD domain-containing protein